MIQIEIRADIDYSVVVGTNWRNELRAIVENHQKVLLFAPEFIAKNLNLRSELPALVHLHILPEGEEQKSIAEWSKAMELCGELGLTRSDAIIALGGGATTDFAGFVAASWLRGIAWYAFPTTLAAMVDAAIGGKTGLNTAHGKNLVGAFYSPKKVVIDPTFLETLSDRDFAAGLAEVIKTGFIGSARILEILEASDDIAAVRANAIELIELAVAFKGKVVSSDFKEGRLREILNYGHTLGHAIERRENFLLRHGEAVAIGLIFAAELSHALCGLTQEEVEAHRRLLTRFNLPTTYSATALPELIESMRGDKKARGDRMRFIGLSRAGEPEWLEEVKIEEIQEAYGKISS